MISVKHNLVYFILIQLITCSASQTSSSTRAIHRDIQDDFFREVRTFICSLPPYLINVRHLNDSLSNTTIKDKYKRMDNYMHGTRSKKKNSTSKEAAWRDTLYSEYEANASLLSSTTIILRRINDFLKILESDRYPADRRLYLDIKYMQSKLFCPSMPRINTSKTIRKGTKRIERSVDTNSSTLCLSYWQGDGFCDLGCNTKEFDYDDGDCCYETCIAKLRHYPCGYTGFQCVKQSSGIPAWFQGTQLCFRWRATADAAQCDSKPRGEICAPLGSMTRFYSDNTDSRRGGCRLAWKIKTKNTPAWFRDKLKLCFANYADGNAWQCNNGRTNTQTCVSLNRWLKYMDNTDDRPGGCYMSWKLQYTGVVPSWAKTLKLCFYWSSSENQCDMYGASNHHCAALNVWTTNYKDDTDKRKDGCQMAWGILV